MQVVTFVPDAMLLMSLAQLAPGYQPFHAAPQPRVSTVQALQHSGVHPSRVMGAQRRHLRTHGAQPNHPPPQRSKADANRRMRQLSRSTKLLWSDVVEMRQHDPGTGRKAYAQQVQAHLATVGVSISVSTILEILRGEMWQAPR